MTLTRECKRVVRYDATDKQGQPDSTAPVKDVYVDKRLLGLLTVGGGYPPSIVITVALP